MAGISRTTSVGVVLGFEYPSRLVVYDEYIGTIGFSLFSYHAHSASPREVCIVQFSGPP